MVISDDALAQSFLNRIGYYRLSGYWYPYRESTGTGTSVVVGDRLRSSSKFSEVVELYVFDKRLRLLMMDVIERIEIALRVQITLELGKLGSHAHRDVSALHPIFQRPSDKNSPESSHQKWLRLHDEAFARSKEEFAKHFKSKYAGEHPPIWIAAELWDFGAMSFLYSGMRKDGQLAIAKFLVFRPFRLWKLGFARSMLLAIFAPITVGFGTSQTPFNRNGLLLKSAQTWATLLPTFTL